jgi:hypothetical protein
MCGYCIEAGTLYEDTMHQGMMSFTSGIGLAVYLQECVDITAALDLITLEPVHPLMASVLCCRGLEILISQGFNSAAYQALLGHPTFLVAIGVFTNDQSRRGYLAQDARFDLARADWLLDRQVFMEAGYLSNRLNHWTLRDAESLLKQYTDLYLKGIGLKRNDLNKLFEETGILDPIDDICIEDRQAFSDRFPAFWCALHWLGNKMAKIPLLWQMVVQPPRGVPDFEGFELWLQRKATLICYDHLGIQPFADNLAAIRSELFLYLTLMRSISPEERALLLAALDRIEVVGKPHDSFYGFNLRIWLETGAVG